MTRPTTSRLSVMMFLEYVIWGSWLPLLALYLTDVLRFSGAEIGWIFATQAIACLVALFAASLIDYRVYQKLAWPILALATALLVPLLLPGTEAIAPEWNGARRWLTVGVTLQPSDLAKLARQFRGRRRAAWIGTPDPAHVGITDRLP